MSTPFVKKLEKSFKRAIIKGEGVDKMPKVNTGFNKSEYDQAYHKAKYKNLAAAFTKEEAQAVEDAAAATGMSKSQFIKTAVFEKIEREGKS